MTDTSHATDEASFGPERPSWAPLTLAGFIALLICTNIAGATWAKLLESSPEVLLMLSSRNRYLVLALGADVWSPGYWVIGFVRIALAFVVCHLIGRAYSATALKWFVKYLGVTPEALEQFNRWFAKAEWVIIPFFAGSNLVAALSGVHRTPFARMALLLSVGIIGRLVLIWWLARIFQEELERFVGWLQRYSWWMVGISVVIVLAVNMRNFRQGAAG
ncbi:hypothetical protein [Ilumatobacter sp.]|uniref:hypothetical protein n=1 Tax=Ilumatobacter sp. TaxID=1967498 RepID=UPI003AF55F9C